MKRKALHTQGFFLFRERIADFEIFQKIFSGFNVSIRNLHEDSYSSEMLKSMLNNIFLKIFIHLQKTK